MPNVIQHKRNSTPGSIPGTGSLAEGELGLNLADGRLYTKNSSNIIINLPVTSISGTSITPASGIFSGRIGVGTTSPSGTLHVVGTGLVSSVTGTAPNSLFHVYSATSGANVFNVEGTNGSLFSVVDSLSGSLMSVNNSAGLPVFEVFSDDRVVAGRYNQNDLVVTSGGNVGIGVAAPTNKLQISGNSLVSGLLSATTGNFNILQVGGTGVSISGHTHLSSDITNFNSSVSGLVSGVYVPITRTITPGSGLAGSAALDLSSNRTLDIGQGDGITVSSDSISVNSTVVRTTGSQGIDGFKTFSGPILFNSGLEVDNIYWDGSINIGTSEGSILFNIGNANILDIQNGLVFLSGNLTANSGNFTNRLQLNGTGVSISGHSHNISDISTFTSSGLAARISDETGSGLLVFNNSPTLTGVPLAPTASSGTNTNQIASTAFVRTEISNLVSSAPSTLDTLNELATALGNNANFSTTVTNSLAGKANLSGATFSGTISAPNGNFTNTLTVGEESGSLFESLRIFVPTGYLSTQYEDATIFSIVNTQDASTVFAIDGYGRIKLGSIDTNQVNNFNNSVTALLPTIGNSGDNRILTSTGSSVGVNAESNLSFDGNTLTINSASSSNTYIKNILNAGDLTDNNGKIVWHNIYNDLNANLAQIDVSIDNTPSEGTLVFHTNDGTSLQERVRITNIGRVGIGTSTPSSSLQVVGLITSNSGNFTVLQQNGVGVSTTTHTHGNISSSGTIGTTSGRPLITTANGVVTTGVFGSASGTFCQGNDSRLSDSRDPNSHTHFSNQIYELGSGYGFDYLDPIVFELGEGGSWLSVRDNILEAAAAVHSHGNITSSGTVGSTSGLAVVTTSDGTITTSSNLSFDTNSLSINSRYTEKVSQLSIVSSGLTIPLSSGNLFTINLNSSISGVTLSNAPSTSGVAIGFTLIFTADGTARSVTWPNSIKWAGGTVPTLTSTNTKRDVLSFVSTDNGTSYLGFVGGQNY